MIKILPDHLVNQIAAGEVVDRPVSVVKELVENSLDAGSTKIMIEISPKNGLDMRSQRKQKQEFVHTLLVKDNGAGIPSNFFDNLCKKHYTNKMEDHSDLRKCRTFGFRGEALHGASYMSSLSIISNCNQDFGIKASFKNGNRIGDEFDIEMHAQGTSVVADDIFSNQPLRKNRFLKSLQAIETLKSVISKFAVHFENVSFELIWKKRSILSVGFGKSRSDRVKLLFPVLLNRNLVEISNNDSDQTKFKVYIMFSEPNTFGNKKKIVMFICTFIFL